MSKHTPGPWFPWQNSAGMWDINTEDRLYAQSLASVNNNEYIEGDAESNAHLIAAAPDLLEALEEIAEGKGEYSQDPLTHASNTIDAMKELANTAIAKARGEE